LAHAAALVDPAAALVLQLDHHAERAAPAVPRQRVRGSLGGEDDRVHEPGIDERGVEHAQLIIGGAPRHGWIVAHARERGEAVDHHRGVHRHTAAGTVEAAPPQQDGGADAAGRDDYVLRLDAYIAAAAAGDHAG